MTKQLRAKLSQLHCELLKREQEYQEAAISSVRKNCINYYKGFSAGTRWAREDLETILKSEKD